MKQKPERYVPYQERINSELRREQEDRAQDIALLGYGGGESFIAQVLAREPDFIQWEDWRTGYPCCMARNPTTGTWCGYVFIPRTHALRRLRPARAETHVNRLNVHGGVTFSKKDVAVLARVWGMTWDTGKPFPANVKEYNEGMVIGFDTGHYMDRMLFISSGTRRVYRDVKYVTREVRKLAQQLKVMEKTTRVKSHLFGSN